MIFSLVYFVVLTKMEESYNGNEGVLTQLWQYFFGSTVGGFGAIGQVFQILSKLALVKLNHFPLLLTSNDHLVVPSQQLSAPLTSIMCIPRSKLTWKSRRVDFPFPQMSPLFCLTTFPSTRTIPPSPKSVGTLNFQVRLSVQTGNMIL